MEREIGIAKKLYDARSVCRRLPGWNDTIPELKRLLQKRAERNKQPVLLALSEVLEMSKDDPVTMIWLMAAAVEIIEPSPNRGADRIDRNESGAFGPGDSGRAPCSGARRRDKGVDEVSPAIPGDAVAWNAKVDAPSGARSAE